MVGLLYATAGAWAGARTALDGWRSVRTGDDHAFELETRVRALKAHG